MGCGLRKLEDPEDSSPGKIYSTLKRPQVETKTDTVYEYVLLDFSLEAGSNIKLQARLVLDRYLTNMGQSHAFQRDTWVADAATQPNKCVVMLLCKVTPLQVERHPTGPGSAV
ncbi:unnamed protein product [Arctogadus glacialis]